MLLRHALEHLKNVTDEKWDEAKEKIENYSPFAYENRERHASRNVINGNWRVIKRKLFNMNNRLLKFLSVWTQKSIIIADSYLLWQSGARSTEILKRS